jgi:hypothetical protein
MKANVAAPVWITEITAVGIRRTDHATRLSPQKLALTSPTSGGRLVGMVLSLTKATELLLFLFQPHCGPGVDSSTNRNEYQEFSKGYRAAGL